MTRTLRTLTTLTTALAVAAISGCADEPEPRAPQTRSEPTPAPTQVAIDDKDDVDTEENPSSIVVDMEIAKLCKLPNAYFAFDSSKLNPTAEVALDKLAECFDDGALAGRRMQIVGHADPRGTVEYNFALGQRRAGSVAEYLIDEGLKNKRVITSSRGELDATGDDPESWARDRKVEISLADTGDMATK